MTNTADHAEVEPIVADLLDTASVTRAVANLQPFHVFITVRSRQRG
jgi:hypothetical protein